jgi:hypothetical protein
MGKPHGHVRRAEVDIGQLDAHPFPKRRRTAADIDRDLEDLAPHHSHQLGLGTAPLPVKPSQRVTHRSRMVRLDEARVDSNGFELLLTVRLDEESSRIAVHDRLQHDDALQLRRDCTQRHQPRSTSLRR